MLIAASSYPDVVLRLVELCSLLERPIINSVLQAAIVVGLGHVEDFLG
jgi:hypothetical protein